MPGGKINGINDLAVIFRALKQENSFKNKDLRGAVKVMG